MNPQFWWFLTRAAGIVAWLMLTTTVLWGTIQANPRSPLRGRAAMTVAVHRWLAALTWWFVAVHLAALVADSYVTFTPTDLLVPFASDWRPGAVALGVLALWILVGVQVTSLVMHRLPRRLWRIVHLASYASFWATSMHGAFAGTDATTWMYRVGALLSIAAVVWTLSARIATRRAVRRAAQVPLVRVLRP